MTLCLLRAGRAAKGKASPALQRLQAERALLASLADDPGILAVQLSTFWLPSCF